MSNKAYNRDYLLECCNGIYDEAFDANACCRIMRQMLNYYKDGYRGMDCSPVFYNTVYKAMYRACIMDLAKIYDIDSKSIKLKTIIDYCNCFEEFIPDRIKTVYPSSDGTQEEEQSLIQITIDSSDFGEIREEQVRQDVSNTTKILTASGISDISSVPLLVDSKTYFKFSGSKYKRLTPLINNLHMQRDKRFAHNDKELLFDYDSLSLESPISLTDMETLVSFALDFVVNTIAILTGEQRAHQFFNIDDLNNTFQLVKRGKESQKNKQ